MTSVRLFKTGGSSDIGQTEEKPKYINFDGVDYDPDNFKYQLSDLNAFSNWADNVKGMRGSKIRNAVSRRVSEMGKALIDGTMTYDGIARFQSNNNRFSSDGNTKKRFFSGNYNSKDENTVNAIASSYILDMLRRSRVPKNTQQNTPTEQQQSEDEVKLVDYDLTNDYNTTFNPALLNTLKTGVDQYVMNELGELYTKLGSDEYKKKYTQQSLQNALNEISSLQGFYNTYNGSKWFDDDKARATLAGISSPFYYTIYNAVNYNKQKPEGDNPYSKADYGKTPEGNADPEDKPKIPVDEQDFKNFVTEYEKENSDKRDWVISSDRMNEITDEDLLGLIDDTVNNDDGIARNQYREEFFNQIGEAFNNATKGATDKTSMMNQYLKYLDANYDVNNGLMASYIKDTNYKPTRNSSVLRALMSKISNNGGVVINNTIDPKTGKGLVIDFDNNGKMLFMYGNPRFMHSNKYIDDDTYNKILQAAYKAKKSTVTQTNKNGGTLYMQYGGIAYNNYNDIIYNPNPNGTSSIYTDNELKLISRFKDLRNKIKTQNDITKSSLRREDKNTAERNSKEVESILSDKKALARMALMASDVLGTVVGFIPGGSIAGLGLGAASSIGNFIMDVSDGGFSGDKFANMATNLGLDVIGAIPYIGTGAKMSKILKATKAILPTIGLFSTAYNLPELKYGINAMQKLGTKGAKMTVQDYKDIAQSMQLILGIVGGGSGVLRNRAIKKNAMNYGKNENIRTIKLTGKDGKPVLADIKKSDLETIGRMHRDANGKKLSNEDIIKAQNAKIKELYGSEYSIDSPITFASGKARFGDRKLGETISKPINYVTNLRYDKSKPAMDLNQNMWYFGKRSTGDVFRRSWGSDKTYAPSWGYKDNRVQYKTRPVQQNIQTSQPAQPAPQQPQPTASNNQINDDLRIGGGRGVNYSYEDINGAFQANLKNGGRIVRVGRFANGGPVYKYAVGGGAKTSSPSTIRNTGLSNNMTGSYGDYLSSWGGSVGKYIQDELDRLYKLKTGTPEQQKLFESERNKFMQNVYNLQKSYKGMNEKTGFGWGKNDVVNDNLSKQHQTQFEQLAGGANDNIMLYGNTVGHGGTNDKADTFVDGYNGNRTALRTFGYSFDGNDKDFKGSDAYKGIFDKAKLVGLTYDTQNDLSGNGKGYYTFRAEPIADNTPSLASISDKPDITPKKIDIKPFGTNTANLDFRDDENSKPSVADIATGVIGSIGKIWEPLITQQVNRNALKTRLKSMKPVLMEYPQLNYQAENGYLAKKAKEEKAAAVNYLANRMANETADAQLGGQYMLSGFSNAYKIGDEGRIESDNIYQTNLGKAMDIRNNNHTVAVQGANQNAAEMARIASIKANMIAANDVNNWQNNWYPFIKDERARYNLNNEIMYNTAYQKYIANASKNVADRMKGEFGENWMSNPNALSLYKRYQNEYYADAPTRPLIARNGGSITRRTVVSVNNGSSLDKFSRNYFKDVNTERNIWLKHYKDVSSENRKEREGARKMIIEFNKNLNYAKKKNK